MDANKWPSLPVTDEWIEKVDLALARERWSDSDLARAIDSTPSTVSRILRQRAFAEHKLVTPISRALSVPTTKELEVQQEVASNELAALALELEALSEHHYKLAVEEIRRLVETLRRWPPK